MILPFKKKQQADVLVGKVEEVADDCQWVRPGIKVAFQRFDYGSQSADIGEDCLIVDEVKDVLILGEHEAAPGIVAVNVIEEKSMLEIPDWVKESHLGPTMFGQVIASGWRCQPGCKNRDNDYVCPKEHVEIDDIIWFRRLPDRQFRLGEHTIIFDNLCKHCRDHVKMDCAADIILAKMEQVTIPKLQPLQGVG